MKRTLTLFVFLGLAAAYFWYGTQESTKQSTDLFETKSSRTTTSLPKARTKSALSQNVFSEMALKMLPESKAVLGSRIASTDEELALHDEFIADHTNLDSAKNYLLNEVPSWEWAKASYRYGVLKFLVESIGSPQNESMDYAVQTVTDVIMANNFKQMGDRMQITLAMADRKFLYQAMMQFHPQKAGEIYERSRGSITGKILDVAQTDVVEARRKATGG